MKQETIERLIKCFNTPIDECLPVTIYGIDQFGNEFSEEIRVPKNGDVVTTESEFYDPIKT